VERCSGTVDSTDTSESEALGLRAFAWWKFRVWLLWQFVKMIPESKTLEIEWQKHRQMKNDYEFGGPNQRENFKYQEGFCDGIMWCMKRFNG
jgi:hypothetical protein